MILRYFIFILCFSCSDNKEFLNLQEYNILLKKKHFQYDFNKDVLRVKFHDYLDTEDTIKLSKESTEKIIQSFFDNKINEIKGNRELLPNDKVTMPPSFSEIYISKNNKLQSYLKIYYDYETIGLLSNKEFKRIKKFNDVMLKELEKNNKYNLIMDSIVKIQRREGMLVF